MAETGEKQRVASCACGQLRAQCSGEPLAVSLCHCLECQKRTGSVFGIAAFFEKKHVVLSGRSTVYGRPSDSGFDVVHHFCPSCGSTVYWYPARKPDLIAMSVGAFADPGFPAPDRSVYRQHRHRWVTIPCEAEVP